MHLFHFKFTHQMALQWQQPVGQSASIICLLYVKQKALIRVQTNLDL